MKGGSLEESIGPSMLCLRGISLEEAIDRSLEGGFSAFELTPITYGGPEAFDSGRCETLRRRLEAFRMVTIHSSGMGGADICSPDPDHRRNPGDRHPHRGLGTKSRRLRVSEERAVASRGHLTDNCPGCKE